MEGAGAIESDETLSVSGAEKIETLLNRRRGNCKAKITKLQTFLKDKAPNARRLLIQSKLDNISEIFSNMESLKIEYYEILEEKLPQLELTFDQMEEDLESIKVGLQTLLLKHDDTSKKVSICDTALTIVGIWSPVLHSYVRGRVILDSISQSHFMTLQFASKLGLEKKKVNLTVSGLSENSINIKWKIKNAFISNKDSSYTSPLDFLMGSSITDFVPSNQPNFRIKKFNDTNRSFLADPTFEEPGKIDMIIGAELFYQIIKDGRAEKEIILDKPLSKEEEFCEMHFRNTYRRDGTGRFIVYMPVQDEELPTLGNSRILAQKRLNQTIKKLDRDPHMHKLYSEFLEEYESLGHMPRIPDKCYSPINYYLPHHGVLKSQNNSTKLRVVFDGSAPTTSGRSLNDILLSGRVQEDVFNIMLRFRKHKIVLTADIKQMFRQILIDPTQRNLLRILWKNKHWEKPIEYELNTVTYDTKSAPFLATRVIKQLCLDESDAFPLAAEITLSDIYMDDIVTGCENIENAEILKNQLIKMFKTCGMTLHKWNSNNRELLDIEYPISEKHLFAQLEECTTKTLGMVWNSKSDTLNFKVSIKEKNYLHQKRSSIYNS
ncbi:integrase catalytic domain-containing protein [Trichonephila inaurata madagascariensis]|uniref:Integrase catalytic domain-containing protein n=1 Tax=Trichonephila inaurata madagascariensis TaxID=2747483 RepID=A0A8X6Y2F0_9ARAC|nr:integrase catalytic domain-containing protein [Trichonephila inaurata madagascariensis]